MSLMSELEDLGELMATNITSKGVSASASDGLTTLAGKILQITGGGGSTTLFEDDCSSASGLSNYGSSECVRGSNATITMTYDSTENAYKVSGSGNYHAYVPITALEGEDEYVISMDLKAFNIRYNKVGLFLDNYNDTTSYGCMFALNCYDKRLDYQQYRLSSDGSSSNTSVSSLQPDTWYRLEYTVNGSSLNAKLYDMNDTLLANKDVTLSVDNKSMGIFLFCETGSTDSTCYVRNIKAESLGGDTPCAEYIAEIDSAIEYINGSGS